ncbi:MAG: sulfotransferase family protein, partial [bacterium]
VMASRLDWRPEKWDEFVAARIAAPAPSPIGASETIPIFVVGLPRTGTTLVATLLARHPQIRNRGELGWLAEIDEQGAPHGYPHGFLGRAAEMYAAQMRRDDQPARFYIDKNPSNLCHLGLAAALFPNARVIHCRRNPRDTALSIWRQHFTDANNGYAYRFRDIARVGAGHDRLMRHWRAVLPLPIHDLKYEALVSSPAETISELLRFVGADETAVAKTVPESPAVIGTSSLWQARQEVNSRSVARWRDYAPHLPELLQFPER